MNENEELSKRLVDRLQMPKEVAEEVAQQIALGLDKTNWQDDLIRTNDKWGKIGYRPGEKNEVTVLGKAMASALSRLITSQVLMDEVLLFTDKSYQDEALKQKKTGETDWQLWKETNGKAVSRARRYVVDGLNKQQTSTGFLSDKDLINQGTTPMDNLSVIGYILGDAHLIDRSGFSDKMGDMPTHPGILRLAKLRGERGEQQVLTGKDIVKDLQLEPSFGRPALTIPR